MVALRLETELLVACAGTDLGPETSERIARLARGAIEWTYVVGKAEDHGIRPLLFRSLNTVCPEIIPSLILKNLRTFVLANATRNLWLGAELIKLLNSFKDRGISAIPFKGPVLGSWAYGDPALRESSDLDILIPNRSLQEAKALLATQGYRQQSPVPSQRNADANEKDTQRYHIFIDKDSGATVDLQPSLEAPHFSFALHSQLWDGAVFREFAGQTILSFCPEHLLILLCVHGTKDVWSRMKWICDIAEFVQRDKEIHWDRILDQAKRLCAKRKFLLGCFLAYDLLHAKLPEHILHNALKEPLVTTAAETIRRRLFVDNRTCTNFERVTLYFRTDDTFRERMKRFLRYLSLYLCVLLVPSDDDRQFLRGADWPSSASYIVRPVRLIAKYGTRPHQAIKAFRDWFRSMS